MSRLLLACSVWQGPEISRITSGNRKHLRMVLARASLNIQCDRHTCMHISLAEDAQISKQLHAFWEVESLGIVNEKTQSPEVTEALQTFNRL